MKGLQRGLTFLLVLIIVFGSWTTAETYTDETWEPLVQGARGEEVKVLQERLIELGYLTGTADGIFGSGTETAVRAFQLAAELEETGIADAETMEALMSEDAPLPTPTPPPAKQSGSGEMVWIPNTGHRYHTNERCSGMKNPSYVTIEEAKRLGFTPCKKCYK